MTNNTLAAQVQQHGEMLVRLTMLVEQDRNDLNELTHAVEIIAKAVAHDEAVKETKATLRERAEATRAKILMIVVPLAAALVGGLAGHILH